MAMSKKNPLKKAQLTTGNFSKHHIQLEVALHNILHMLLS